MISPQAECNNSLDYWFLVQILGAHGSSINITRFGGMFSFSRVERSGVTEEDRCNATTRAALQFGIFTDDRGVRRYVYCIPGSLMAPEQSLCMRPPRS